MASAPEAGILRALLTSMVGFAVTYLLTPPIADLAGRRGIVGIDVHKLDGPRIPEMGGLSIVAGLVAAGLAYAILSPESYFISLAFLAVISLAGAVGAADDLRPLNPLVKPVLTAAASIPIVLLGAYSPRPQLPFIGRARLTIVYPLMVPAAIAITSNAVNMLDVLNGSMTGTAGIATVAIAIALAMWGRYDVLPLAMALIGCLTAFHMYNRYPAKVFAGDTGSLGVGAAIGALSILGSVEIVAVIAMIPHIMNAFHGLSSVGRLYERGEMPNRPVRLMADGRLMATDDPKAPITLTRLILARGPMREADIVKAMLALSASSAAAALVTALLMVRGVI